MIAGEFAECPVAFFIIAVGQGQFAFRDFMEMAAPCQFFLHGMSLFGRIADDHTADGRSMLLFQCILSH